MACCSGIIKYFLFVFNILFWIAGGIVLGLGIYLRASDNVEFVLAFGGLEVYYAGSYVLMTAGALMFVVGFFGCCGAIKESKCLLICYFVSLLIIFALEIGVGIWALVKQDDIDAYMQAQLSDQTPIVYDEEAGSYPQSVIATEKNFQCCGVTNGCSDWQNGVAYGCGCTPSSDSDETCGAVPNSCSADPLMPDTTTIYQKDCYQSVYDFIMKNLTLIAGVGLGIGLAEIFGMIFACIMIRNKKKDYNTY